MVYNNFPWPQFGTGEYPVTGTGTPRSVRETHIAFLTTPPDGFYEALSKRTVAKKAGDTAAENPKITRVKTVAQAVLDARANHPLSTLADLYDPLTMPAALVKAHADLDRAVDQCYQKQPCTSDRQRVEFLFDLYEQYTSPLLPTAKPKRRPKRFIRGVG